MLFGLSEFNLALIESTKLLAIVFTISTFNEKNSVTVIFQAHCQISRAHI